MKTSKAIPPNVLIFLFVFSLLAMFTTACGDNSTNADPEPPADIQTTSTQSHGEVLADSEGNILYFFTHDVSGESKCEGECINSWPEFHMSQLEPSEDLDPDNFDTITRPDGNSQTTYKGWPLYYFAGDEQPGDINGDGVNDVWFAANPDYSLMIADEQLVGADGNNYTSDYQQGEEITTYVTDADGRTLYIFMNDSANTNTCTSEGCMDNWPVFHVDIGELPSNLDAQNFGEMTAHGDRQQLTYRGWPVYYFAGDEVRGDTRGVNVPDPGVWPVIQEDTPPAPVPEDNDSVDNTDPNNDDASNNDDGNGDDGY